MRRAFLLLDVVVGIAIVGVLLLIMAATLTRQQQATGGLADHRRATRAAESALLDLQMGRPTQPGGEKLAAREVPASAPAGFKWIEVEAARGKQHSTLVGLVPQAASIPATQPAGGQP